MSLSRLSTFRLQSLINCSVVLFMFFNFFQPFVHPLSFSIKDFGRDANKILYEGDAAPSSGVIELSTITATDLQDIYCRTGRATYAEPLHLWDSAKLADFTTNFSFIIDTVHNDTNIGDGLVFFLAPVHYPIPPNSAGGDLGLLNTTTRFGKASQNQIVMVEFDTSPNSWDPLLPHVGININTISSVVNARWDALGNCGKKAHVQITYSATTKNLTVFWTYEEYTDVAITSLSYNIDLRKVLPEWVTIGFSTANGCARERNAIYTWDFGSNSKELSTKKERRLFSIVAVEVSVFILIVGVAICWLVVKRQINRIDEHGNDSNSVASTDLVWQALPRRFSYKELVAATNDFANDRRLGQGGSGKVYKGIIQDLGCTVAVKRIVPESEHYEKVFINEVKIISRLIHRNLVQFIGWCHEQGECLLVYAYMPNSSLDTHLFGSRTTLQWDLRYKIALDLATAVHYLHEDAETCVLHRDIKSANVLLDYDFKTKLGDFGIAKLVDPRFRTQTTGVVGTFGYIAPEYANGGRASKESDMYSFGVVALELACGRRTYQYEEYHVPLFRWVWQLYLAGNLLSAADERLDMNFVPNEMECLLIVGLWCTHPDNKERPKAGQVMRVLQLEAPLPQLPKDLHDHPPPQPQQEAGSSQQSLTSSFETVGR
ncbi:L-type lectin-domain containing receptor kinase IX.1-like [Prunus avium]|uniref:L-type lectin-domain containing receptor kinase IX.1-like n=1 Tax=Prunus avium TaxID=42229 RepID=A0A6P5U1B3_PRUAV|nr:L-type lectin-domain containing receptor kinase IX.1-like [Prunus avium]